MIESEIAPAAKVADTSKVGLTLKADRKIAALIAAGTLLVFLVATLSLWAFAQIKAAAQTREHIYQLVAGANALLGKLVDAETSQRGFLLTADEDYLQPYVVARDDVTHQVKALRLKAANSAAIQHLNTLAPLVEAKLAHMAQNIALRRQQDLPAVPADASLRQGMQLMDSIRAEISRFIQIEEALLAQYETTFQLNLGRLFALIIATSLFTFLLSLLFAYTAYRNAQLRVKEQRHLETRQLLDTQTETNKRLQQTNVDLHVSEEKLAVTLNSIGDAVIATDAAGRVTLMNPQAELLTGWTRLEAAHRPVEEVFRIIDRDTRQPHVIPVRESLAHGTMQGLTNHTLLIARDGRTCDIADCCAPIRNRDGVVVGAVLVFRDVTEREHLYQMLQDRTVAIEAARAVADKANQAKSEFLSSMSHELRTPLSAILGFAQLMDSATPQPTPAQKRSLEQILKGGWYLLELINEILDLALIESGKLSLALAPMSLVDVMHECQTMIEPQAQQRGVRVIFPSFDGERRLNVHADHTRVKQILINLLSNAIKYNTLGGTVAVDYVTDTPGRIRLRVKDSGAGLSAEQLTHLFQPFNRLGRESTGEQGTGIGLVMAKRLVELMGGVIGVESTVGQGSTFWIELTMTDEPQHAAAAPLTTVTPAHGVPRAPRHTLLYVEDNPANLMLVEDILERLPDIRLLSAADGLRGVELARSALPDVILMDINLPGISGMQALQILAADPATAHIPIVALSANAMPRDIEKGLAAGFFRYLTKPININAFMETLDVALKFADTRTHRVTKAQRSVVSNASEMSTS
jgi:PAS domain S-box-containing protein